jgi:hypothetical protein
MVDQWGSWEDAPLAKDVLRHWLESHGFAPMQKVVEKGAWQPGMSHGDGYFTKNTDHTKSVLVGDTWGRAVVGYRGGGVTRVQEKLRAVTEVFDRLGVEWEEEWTWTDPVYHNVPSYPFLVVTISDALNGELADVVPEEPVSQQTRRRQSRKAQAETEAETTAGADA